MANALNHARSDAGNENDPFSFLKLLAEASAVVVGFSFIAGWSYLASYYRTFGVNPLQLDVPVPVVATLALHALYNSVWPLVSIAVAIAVLAAVAHYFVSSRIVHRWWVVATLILLLFLSATASLIRGRHNANVDMIEESPNLPLVAFATRSASSKLGPPEQPSCVGYEAFGAMDCKLLLHSGGLYYFFKPIPEALVGKTDKLDLFAIPDSEVLGIHIQRGIDLSEDRK